MERRPSNLLFLSFPIAYVVGIALLLFVSVPYAPADFDSAAHAAPKPPSIVNAVDYVYRAKTVRVVDGDTLELDVDLGFGITKRDMFRLNGIDTPEIHGVRHDSAEYKRGLAASAFVKAVLFKRRDPVLLRLHTIKDKQGKYGRYLAKIELPDGSYLSTLLREAGHEKGTTP